MKDFFPKFVEFFDADPFVLPKFPSEVPREVPRLIFQNKSGTWRCEIASARINIFWLKNLPHVFPIGLQEFYEKALTFLLEYQTLFGTQVGRLAALATRFSEHDNPALFLTSHFCKDNLCLAPFNNTRSFELHAHKQYLFKNKYKINSWARNKTGYITTNETKKPIVLCEQDINTLGEETESRSFSQEDISEFFNTVAPELNNILELYYPANIK